LLEGRPWGLRVAAAVLLGLEALTVAVRGRQLLGVARRHPHHGYGVAALMLVAACVVLVVLAACVAADLRWARWAAAAAQLLLAVGSLVRLPAHPVASVVGLLVEATLGVLLLVPAADTRTAPGGGLRGGPGDRP
jgi:hypothetical protein